MKIKINYILLYLVFIFSCTSNQGVIEKRDIKSDDKPSGHILQAVLWYQLSAEYRAIAYQTYQLAELRLNEILDELPKDNNKPLAIITDLDETVLDNSPFFAELILTDSDYSSKSWKAWTEQRNAKLISGAHRFFNIADQKGVEIFYVSNRHESETDATIENLKKRGLPYADKEHIFLRGITSDKEPRRIEIDKTYKTIMLLGDNLSDFSKRFDVNENGRRNEYVDSLKNTFGKEYIIFPNPIYGNWEKDGILNGHYKWKNIQKDSLRHSKLIGYKNK